MQHLRVWFQVNDNSEWETRTAGGTFAIYSLLSRKIGITPFGEVQKFGNSEEAEEEFDPALYLKLNGENPQPPQKPRCP